LTLDCAGVTLVARLERKSAIVVSVGDALSAAFSPKRFTS
jgi:hypothetical protein